MIATWQAPLANGKTCEELVVAFNEQRAMHVLVIPALFDEANKLRRFTVEVMRRLDAAGIDAFLPDLPGCNDSLAPLSEQTLSNWRNATKAAAAEFSATHVLSIRAGALIAPSDLPGWRYAPQTGPKLLRAMLRARTIASREAGREENSEQLTALGRNEGLDLAGWAIGPAMFRELETAEPPTDGRMDVIEQKQLGGPGLWLRAEPDDSAEQADALAAILASSQGQPE